MLPVNSLTLNRKGRKEEIHKYLLSTNNSRYFMCFTCFSFYWMSAFIIITEDKKQTKQSSSSKG